MAPATQDASSESSEEESDGDDISGEAEGQTKDASIPSTPVRARPEGKPATHPSPALSRFASKVMS
jgi:hypothetical protein